MDFPLPPVGEGLIEVELVRWLVKPGDAVRRGQSLMEVMSDKAAMEVPSPFEGVVRETAGEPGEKVQVGQVVLSYDPAGAAAANPGREQRGTAAGNVSAPESVVVAAAPASESHSVAHAPGSPSRLPPAAPSVRLLARKLGIDLARVRGTGPSGRILIDDLTPLLASKAGRNGEPSPPPAPPKPDFGTPGTRVKVVGLRRRIAEHLVEAKRHAPHYSYIDECDFTDLVRLRQQLREPFAKAGVKLTFLAFAVKAVARALKDVPLVNSTFDEAAGEIVLHDRYHVGVAVAAPHGLLVPVVRDADKKDVATIARDVDRLAAAAKAGRAAADDLKGGTFTVTSVGGIGGLISTPVLNYPEAGILGVGKVVRRPVYDAAGRVRPADMAYLSFSFDHRVVDGAIGAEFGNAVLRHLQAPATLLLPEGFGT